MPVQGCCRYGHIKCMSVMRNSGRAILMPGTCFSKVPKLLGSILGSSIPVIPSQRRGAKPSNFAFLSVFRTLKTRWKIRDSKQADCNLTTGFSGLKSSRDFSLDCFFDKTWEWKIYSCELLLSSEPQKWKFHVIVWQTTSKNCTKKLAPRAARLLFLIQPITSLICGVVPN